MAESPRPRHLASCGRKQHRYLTEEEAQTALTRHWPKGVPLTLEVYKCTACAGWHWGRRSGSWGFEDLLLAWCRQHTCDR